jgi:antitoxin component YwqK of YwqJK toxin-antitoxin module
MMKRLIIISLVLFFFFNILSAQAQNQVDPDGFNRFYYPNGQVSSEGYLRNGQPDGYWKTYFENGSLKSEGNRIDFLLDSTWTFYDENGNKTLEVNYKAGMKEGKRFTYRENETIEENFSNDIKQGQTIYYYLDNRIFRIINFENGLEEGMAKEYADDGRVILITTYRKGFLISRERINRLDSEGRKQGYWKFFHKNGLVKLEGFYLNDLKNGFFKEYDSTGKLVEATKWLKGEIQEQAEELTKLEVSKEYYPDGKIAVFQTFKNGIPHGVKRDYSKEGTIVSGSLYKEGKLIASGITREDGVRNGAWKDYYSAALLNLEFNGIVKALPGKIYKFIG